MLTQERLKQILDYNPDTGIFTWKELPPKTTRAHIGSDAGTINNMGYRIITIHKQKWLAHRLAFLFMVGRWPQEEIDHINGIAADNRWVNLREATCAQNRKNTPAKGIHRKRNRWIAQIMADGVAHYLGCFKTPEEATAARLEAEKRFYGVFSRRAA